jgi:hypothetical protein
LSAVVVRESLTLQIEEDLVTPDNFSEMGDGLPLISQALASLYF